MFGLFKSKPELPKVNFKVYKTEVAKYKALAENLREKASDKVLLGCFFKDTEEELNKLLRAANVAVRFTNFTTLEYISNENSFDEVIIGELHPLKSRFYDVVSYYEKSPSIICYTSLDNPFFEQLGGGRLPALMDSLGMDEFEEINHSMVDKAISRAQEKADSKIEVEQLADSLSEWMKLNLPETNS
ncbi:preprotein translocase subunit SecA [Fulvivirga lutea]|uniref:Preprotein translocase subunit SecA n=1 Tax=Fulvivirga lutea TaxID=2810512 RepID=A0A974WF71_9BACT|nr:preprotein translocase subunit SecA [Fulvivirga lutea]QSE96353.1 preprotein translocase subunit SecA [Fulvivirga lutea]